MLRIMPYAPKSVSYRYLHLLCHSTIWRISHQRDPFTSPKEIRLTQPVLLSNLQDMTMFLFFQSPCTGFQFQTESTTYSPVFYMSMCPLVNCTLLLMAGFSDLRRSKLNAKDKELPLFRTLCTWNKFLLFCFSHFIISSLSLSLSPVSYTHLTLPTRRTV